MEIPVKGFPLPEGNVHFTGGDGQNKNIVVGETRDLPVLGSEVEALPDFGLPDKFLIQLTDPVICGSVPEVKIAPVRNGASRDIQLKKGAFFGGDRVVQPVDGNPRPEIPDFCPREPA